MMIIWLLLQIFVFASFAIPSDSMEPVLIPGDYVLVNKMLKGPRIFSLGDARQHKPLHIDRLKGFSEFQRNEVLVFNFPYPERWDSVGFNLMLYLQFSQFHLSLNGKNPKTKKVFHLL